MKGDPTKFTTLETATDKDEAQFWKAVEHLKRVSTPLDELRKEIAKARFQTYRAYLAAGFSPEQALELLKAEVK
jgi:rRNA processing protein Krr1/Pno1